MCFYVYVEWSDVIETKNAYKFSSGFFYSSHFITTFIKIWWHFWCDSLRINIFFVMCTVSLIVDMCLKWTKTNDLKRNSSDFLCEFCTLNYFNGEVSYAVVSSIEREGESGKILKLIFSSTVYCVWSSNSNPGYFRFDGSSKNIDTPKRKSVTVIISIHRSNMYTNSHTHAIWLMNFDRGEMENSESKIRMRERDTHTIEWERKRKK